VKPVEEGVSRVRPGGTIAGGIIDEGAIARDPGLMFIPSMGRVFGFWPSFGPEWLLAGMGIWIGSGAVSGAVWSPLGIVIDRDGGGTAGAGPVACALANPAKPVVKSRAAIDIRSTGEPLGMNPLPGLSTSFPICAPPGLPGIGRHDPQPRFECRVLIQNDRRRLRWAPDGNGRRDHSEFDDDWD
jgi:hypothetical protein